jgi:hypothetical protein
VLFDKDYQRTVSIVSTINDLEDRAFWFRSRFGCGQSALNRFSVRRPEGARATRHGPHRMLTKHSTSLKKIGRLFGDLSWRPDATICAQLLRRVIGLSHVRGPPPDSARKAKTPPWGKRGFLWGSGDRGRALLIVVCGLRKRFKREIRGIGSSRVRCHRSTGPRHRPNPDSPAGFLESWRAIGELA